MTDFTEERIHTGKLKINTVSTGAGPLVLFVHGWPELSHSWRHQMKAVAAAGFRAMAVDVRGYGASDKPWEIEAYSLNELASDIAAVIEKAAPGKKAVIAGHDWGAPIVYTTALNHRELIRAVIGMSVPHTGPAPALPTDLWKMVYKDKFFYMTYFQQPGVAELEFGQNNERALRMIYNSIAGDREKNTWLADRPANSAFLTGMKDTGKRPSFMTEEDFQAYVRSFSVGGWRGPINRYRNLDRDWHNANERADHQITCPALFIGGSRDPVRHFVPGHDAFERADLLLPDCRGKHIIDGAGHWVQQEAPAEVNAAVLEFLGTLD